MFVDNYTRSTHFGVKPLRNPKEFSGVKILYEGVGPQDAADSDSVFIVRVHVYDPVTNLPIDSIDYYDVAWSDRASLYTP